MIFFDEIKSKFAVEIVNSVREFLDVDATFFVTPNSYGWIAKRNDNYYGAEIKKSEDVSELDAYLSLRVNCIETLKEIK